MIQADLGLGPTSASWVTSVIFLSMALTAIPVGMALDGVDNRTGLVGSAAWLFLATVWGWQAAVSGSYVSLLASRFVGGPAIVAIWTASVNITGAVAPEEDQATAITLYATSVPLGFAVGQFATPVIANPHGWGVAMLLFGIATVLVACAFWIGSTKGAVNGRGTARPSGAEFATVFHNRAVWGVALLAFIAISVMFIINNWMPSYFREQYQVSLAEGGLFAALFPAIGVLSRGFSGLISDRALGGRRKPVVVFAFLVAAPATYGIVVVKSIGLTLALLLLSGFFSQIGQVLLFVYVRELVDPNVVGTALAVVNAMGFMGGFIAPIATGALIERSGAYVSTFAVASGIAVLAVVITLLIPESNPTTHG